MAIKQTILLFFASFLLLSGIFIAILHQDTVTQHQIKHKENYLEFTTIRETSNYGGR